jgi:DNA-binding SARP family transcriptional activator
MLAPPEYGTRQHILAWLAQQPPRAKFNWDDCTTCAVARYANAHGRLIPFRRALEFTRDLMDMNQIGHRLSTMHRASDMVTFGRLRRALEKYWGDP